MTEAEAEKTLLECYAIEKFNGFWFQDDTGYLFDYDVLYDAERVSATKMLHIARRLAEGKKQLLKKRQQKAMEEIF
jgi:hypothetical protein